MIKAVVAGLAMLPAMAMAWDSPQQAIEQFVAWELGGARLQSDDSGMEKHVHLEPEYGGIGADTVMVSEQPSIGKLRCKGDRCKVVVSWHLPAMEPDDAFPVGNGTRASAERVTYIVLEIDGDWRIDSRSLTDFPYISPQTLETYRAALAEDEAEVGDGS